MGLWGATKGLEAKMQESKIGEMIASTTEIGDMIASRISCGLGFRYWL